MGAKPTTGPWGLTRWATRLGKALLVSTVAIVEDVELQHIDWPFYTSIWTRIFSLRNSVKGVVSFDWVDKVKWWNEWLVNTCTNVVDKSQSSPISLVSKWLVSHPWKQRYGFRYKRVNLCAEVPHLPQQWPLFFSTELFPTELLISLTLKAPSLAWTYLGSPINVYGAIIMFTSVAYMFTIVEDTLR